MADIVCNIAKGRVAEFYNRVQTNDPAAAVLVIAVFSITGGAAAEDAAIADADSFADIEGNANIAEVTNTNYARITLADTDLAAYAPDDVNDRVDLDVQNQTWSAVAAGDVWAKLVIGYAADGNGAAANNANIVPLTAHDFPVTPDGTDITAVIDAAGFVRAS